MKYSILLCMGLLHNSNAFISNIPVHGKLCRRLRLQYQFYIKNNIEHLTLTKERVAENMITIIKDDLSNDLLYYVKLAVDSCSSSSAIILGAEPGGVMRHKHVEIFKRF